MSSEERLLPEQKLAIKLGLEVRKQSVDSDYYQLSVWKPGETVELFGAGGMTGASRVRAFLQGWQARGQRLTR